MSDVPSAEQQELMEILADIAPTIDRIDLAAEDAALQLETTHPFASPGMRRIRELCEHGVQNDWLVPRKASPTTSFGRLTKDLGGYAVDAVLMTGPGMGHTHPLGEVTIGFAWEGDDPRFDGMPAGWVVYPPGSHHVPTVTDGKMLFVYFLPGGEVVWDT